MKLLEKIADKARQIKQDWNEDYSTRRAVGGAMELGGILGLAISQYPLIVQGDIRYSVPALISTVVFSFGQVIRNNAIRDEAIDTIRREIKREREKRKEEGLRRY